MKPTDIHKILDLAFEARKAGKDLNPRFIGDAGLGKSEITQAWAAKKDEELKDEGGFGFLDIRIAYYEGPDLVGFPNIEQEKVMINGQEIEIGRTKYAIPELWPSHGQGIIFLEEISRGNDMVHNALMQLLTDRKIGPHFKIPDGWIIASCDNPTGTHYNTQEIDTALADRFTPFQINYDSRTFKSFIESANWHRNVKEYVFSDSWLYKEPAKIGKEGRYISPRTWSKMNAAEIALEGMTHLKDGEKKQLHRTICDTILGKAEGAQYFKFVYDDAPVFARDLLQNKKKALQKLKDQCKKGSYAGDKINVTVESILENYGGWYDGCDFDQEDDKIDEETMIAVCMIIPSDQAVNLIKEAGVRVSKEKINVFFKGLISRHPDCAQILKSNIKINRVKK